MSEPSVPEVGQVARADAPKPTAVPVVIPVGKIRIGLLNRRGLEEAILRGRVNFDFRKRVLITC